MVENIKQEIITLKGRLKMDIASGISINGDNFCKVPLEVIEAKKNGQKISDQFDSIILMFWMKEKNFDSKTQSIISNLKKDQTITVHGNIAGTNNGLMKVIELETEEDIFI